MIVIVINLIIFYLVIMGIHEKGNGFKKIDLLFLLFRKYTLDK